MASSKKVEILEPTASKESFLNGLLVPNTDRHQQTSNKVLISEIDNDISSTVSSQIETVDLSKKEDEPVSQPTVVSDEPSMLELMMEAQKAALTEKNEQRSKEQQKASKSGFGGFKKGFFGGTTAKSKDKKIDGDVIEVKRSTTTSKPIERKDQIVEEVQRAMQEDENPLVKQLKSNEWVTNDLMSNISSNPIISNGLKNPRCVTAMELLQKNPKEAQLKYQNDPEVGMFLQEFCKVMGAHFSALGESQQQQPQREVNSTNASSASRIEEIGPLQAKALSGNKTANSTAPPSTSNSTAVSTAGSSNSEDDQVQKILADPELRTLLMDPAMQQILVDCGDASKLRKHMQNPEIYRKIRKLSDAGLVKFEG